MSSFSKGVNGMSKKIKIIINSNPFEVSNATMTGLEIKTLAGEPAEYLLVLIVKDPDPQAGGDDKPIGDGDVVELKSGMRFRVVNPGTFGKVWN